MQSRTSGQNISFGIMLSRSETEGEKEIMGENDIQSACQGALQAYYRDQRKKFTQFAPYSNQQSASVAKTSLFAADVVGIIQDSSLLLLEMKYCDVDNEVLPKFCQNQHQDLLAMEKQDIPVAYCYNFVHNLAYFDQESDLWPEITLGQLKRSAPSVLPDKHPAMLHHPDLLTWIKNVETRETGGDNFANFAGILNGLLRPGQIRNQILVLLYSNKLHHMVGMDAQGLSEFANWILSNPAASAPAIVARANRIKGLLTPSTKAHIRSLRVQQNNAVNMIKNEPNSNNEDDNGNTISLKL